MREFIKKKKKLISHDSLRVRQISKVYEIAFSACTS